MLFEPMLFSSLQTQVTVCLQAAVLGDMDRAERLCMVFTQFCDYNVSTLGAPSGLVRMHLCFVGSIELLD